MRVTLILAALSCFLQATLARYGANYNPAICEALVNGTGVNVTCPATHDCLPPDQGPFFLEITRAFHRLPPGLQPRRYCIPKRCANETNPAAECGGDGARCKHVESRPTDGSVLSHGWCHPGCGQKMMMKADIVEDANGNIVWTRFRENTRCNQINGTRTAFSLTLANDAALDANSPLVANVNYTLTYCNKPGKLRTENYIRATTCKKRFCSMVKQQLTVGATLSPEDIELEKCLCRQRCPLPGRLGHLGCRLRKQPTGGAICRGRCLNICPRDIFNLFRNRVNNNNGNNITGIPNIPNIPNVMGVVNRISNWWLNRQAQPATPGAI